ncbi:hypothetical protein PCA31118_05233 [Pandoraea captiosa]|uniref:Lipoprotein n=1 Tax=Pandoraea captiosa TaxID=2508302 RepID=A0A5E5ATJ3_9BURK|nr:hypothetical protein [Pandoraea captiosa]VVE76538.1 hypothetical protein PCA31118_05233 [Pandoraea captiosa]
MKTLRSIFAAILGFAAGCAVIAGLAWAGGYNFDTRNPDVAFGCFMALVFGVAVASAAYMAAEERKS